MADLTKRNIRPKLWLGGDAWNANGELSTKILKDSHAHALISTQWLPQNPVQAASSFSSKYKRKFGHGPVDAAALEYDGMTVLLKALMSDQTRTRQGVNQAIGNLGTIKGVTGTMTFYPDRVTPDKAVNLLLINGDIKTLVPN